MYQNVHSQCTKTEVRKLLKLRNMFNNSCLGKIKIQVMGFKSLSRYQNSHIFQIVSWLHLRRSVAWIARVSCCVSGAFEVPVFIAAHSAVRNPVSRERRLHSLDNFKLNRTAALAGGRLACVSKAAWNGTCSRLCQGTLTISVSRIGER